MGLLTTVKETVLADDEEAGEAANERGSPAAAESASADSPADAWEAGADRTEAARTIDAWESEADYVVSTGHSRKDALLELVEASGGRVKQAEVVRRTGWSKATVSRHLSQLEAAGAIERIPVGRCKVVLLPDESLFDDESVVGDESVLADRSAFDDAR